MRNAIDEKPATRVFLDRDGKLKLLVLATIGLVAQPPTTVFAQEDEPFDAAGFPKISDQPTQTIDLANHQVVIRATYDTHRLKSGAIFSYPSGHYAVYASRSGSGGSSPEGLLYEYDNGEPFPPRVALVAPGSPDLLVVCTQYGGVSITSVHRFACHLTVFNNSKITTHQLSESLSGSVSVFGRMSGGRFAFKFETGPYFNYDRERDRVYESNTPGAAVAEDPSQG